MAPWIEGLKEGSRRAPICQPESAQDPRWWSEFGRKNKTHVSEDRSAATEVEYGKVMQDFNAP